MGWGSQDLVCKGRGDLLFRPGEWNEMVIVGRGPRLTQTVNGVVLSELVDLDGKHATSKGLLALQDHGKGTVVHYKNIHLKVLP